MKTQIGIGLGGNLNNPHARLLNALELLEEYVDGLTCSSFYETRAFPDPAEPVFLNAVALGFTTLAPSQLLRLFKGIESRLGRQPRQRWASREIDLDLLFHGELVLETAKLKLPHVGLHERDCVLVPLAELDHGWRHPVLNQTADELYAHLPADQLTIIRRLE